MSQAGFWRDAGFWWLAKAQSDRLIAVLAGLSADPRCAALRANAIAEARTSLAKVRDKLPSAKPSRSHRGRSGGPVHSAGRTGRAP